MSPRRFLVLASIATGAWGSALACGGGEAARPEVVSPSVAGGDASSALGAETPVVPVVPVVPDVPEEARDAGLTSWRVEDAAIHLPPPRVVPEPAYGAAEPVRPGDAHAFRLAAAVKAMRASPSGAKIVKMLSVIPDVIEAKARTGVEPFADAEWLVVYGSRVAVPGPNANVIKHVRPEGAVAKSVADGGFEAWDAGSSAPVAPGTGGAVRGAMYGVRDVLLRPQPGVLALVPGDRARELAAVLAKPIDPGVKPGELARIDVAEPAKVAHFLPAGVLHATVIVKPASDSGLDLSAEADCPDAASCTSTATALEEMAKRSNSMMVRIVTRNLLGGIAVRADGAKLKATLHAAPDQVSALLNLLRAQLGLPPPDPGDSTQRP